MMTFPLHHPLRGAMLLGAFLAGLFGITIFQVNALTSSVYGIGDQQRRVEQLQEQAFSLEKGHTQSLSRARMQEAAELLGFERVQSVSYLKVLGSAVAASTSQK